MIMMNVSSLTPINEETPPGCRSMDVFVRLLRCILLGVTEWGTSHPGVVAGIASSGKQLQADPAQSLQSFDDRSFDLGLLIRSQSGQRVHWSQDRPKFLQQRPIMLTGIQSEALTRKLHA